MRKKRLLLVMTSMEIGGIATAVNNLLNATSDYYDFDLVLFNDDVLPEGSVYRKAYNAGRYMRLTSISQKKAMEESKLLGVYRIILGVMARLFGHKWSYKLLLKSTKPLDYEYDIAISCTQSAPLHSLYGGCNEYVLKKVTANKKIAMIHCDYNLYGISSNYNHNIYSEFDKICAVSESVREGFIKCEPELSDRTVVVPNFHNYERIMKLADVNTVIYDDSKFHIVTIARLGREKGHARMIPIVIHLKNMGYKFVWHIVGGQKNELPKETQLLMDKSNTEENIVFYGSQENPYRFMKNAHLLLIPSYHEAAPMVYSEAHCLGLPILTTKTLSAKELVENTGIGIVCDNNDESLEKALINILESPNLLNQFRNINEKANNNEAFLKFKLLLSES